MVEWQLSISFLDTYVFSEYFFTSVRVTLGLLAINVEKPLRWRLLFFCWFLYFLGELLLRKLSIQSINKFQEIGIKTHLAQGFSLQYFTKCLRLIIVLKMIKPEAQIKGTSIFYFFFVLVNGAASKNPISKNPIFHITFTLFSIYDQIGVKSITRLRVKYSYLSNLRFRHKFKNFFQTHA